MKAVLFLILPLFLAQDVPSVEFTIKDVLNVIAEYDVRHVDVPISHLQRYGQTDFFNRKIYIFRSDAATEKATVIHEIIHVLYHQRGLYPVEERILQEEQKIYVALYGLPGMTQEP